MTLPDIASDLPGIALRTAIVYIFVIVALRISGKREVGQFSIFELVVVLIISNAVQNAMVGDNTTVWGGMTAVITLLTLDIVLRQLTSRIRPLRRAIEGEPRLLVRNGQLLPKAIREERIDLEDVMAALRGNGVARLEEVRLAVLETDGTISVVPFKDGERPTATAAPPGATG